MDLALKNPVRVRVDQKMVRHAVVCSMTPSMQGVALNLTEEFVRIRPEQEVNREAIVLALCARSFKAGTMLVM